jgi:hypothetical protein
MPAMSYSIADRARFFLWNALICFVDPVWIRIEVGRRREERGQQLGSKALIRENLQGVGFFECASISVTGRRTMKKIIPYLILLLIAACGPQFYLPETKDRPAQIVVSTYTQDGCIEELQEEAKRRGVAVRLKSVETDLGWEIFLFPFYKGYKCTGEVTGPLKQ